MDKGIGCNIGQMKRPCTRKVKSNTANGSQFLANNENIFGPKELRKNQM